MNERDQKTFEARIRELEKDTKWLYRRYSFLVVCFFVIVLTTAIRFHDIFDELFALRNDYLASLEKVNEALSVVNDVLEQVKLSLLN